MESDFSDSPQETDSSDEGGDDDLSNLGATKTEIKSFTVKQESFKTMETGSDLAGSPLSRDIVPKSMLRDLEYRGDQCATLVQQNFIQVQQQFGDVTVHGTRNLTIGGTQNIGATGLPKEEDKPLTLTEKIMKRTTRRIKEWTQGMVKTSALKKVMNKLNTGVTWITIKGSPGEGKTTAAYMALGELQTSGRKVFHVITPEEFSEVTLTCSSPVVMLDDIFGNLAFDQAEWLRWKPVLNQVLSVREHRSNKLDDEENNEVSVILVGRDYVLNFASFDMGRISEYFTRDMYVVHMSHTVERDLQEKLAIVEAVSESRGMRLDQSAVDKLCHLNCPHGFPHVCRLFVTLRQEDPNVTGEQFFETPLEFLNQTVWRLMHDKALLLLFKEMMKKGGKVGFCELSSLDSSTEITEAAYNLVGTYLRKEDGCFIFDHPSIYDSVAYNLCKRFPLFVIENCSLSFLHEILRIEHTQETSSKSGLVVDIPRSFITDLAQRFAAEMSNKSLIQVLSHRAFTDELFVKELMSLIPLPLSELLKVTDVKTLDTFLVLIPSSRSPQLLKYIDKQTDVLLTRDQEYTVLYGVLRHAASDVLTYLIHTRRKFNINCKYGWMKQTPLMIAAGTRDSEFVHEIMSLKPDLNASDRLGKRVLQYLCENGLVSAVGHLVDEGVDIDVQDRYDQSPLFYACCSNEVEVMRLLLDRGARLDTETVVEACRRGNMDVVTLLFEKGATVDMTLSHDTPLTSACHGGHVKIINFLLDKGASVDTNDESGCSPLHVACCYNKHQAVQCLLENGADINCRDSRGDTPLHIAAGRGSKECVHMLLKAGSQVNVQNTSGDTALHIVAGKGSKECVEMLLDGGADVNVQNTYCNTALHTAAGGGSAQCINVILQHVADVNVQNTYGNTALHIAAGRAHNTCVHMLLKAGALVDITDNRGQIPLHKSFYYKDIRGLHLPDISVCQTLVGNGADVNKQDKEGNTPLHLLCQVDINTSICNKDKLHETASRYEDVYKSLVLMLLDHGADMTVQNYKEELALRGWCQCFVPETQKANIVQKYSQKRGKTECSLQ